MKSHSTFSKVKLQKLKNRILTEIAPYTSMELIINIRTETAKRTQALSKKTKTKIELSYYTKRTEFFMTK